MDSKKSMNSFKIKKRLPDDLLHSYFCHQFAINLSAL